MQGLLVPFQTLREKLLLFCALPASDWCPGILLTEAALHSISANQRLARTPFVISLRRKLLYSYGEVVTNEVHRHKPTQCSRSHGREDVASPNVLRTQFVVISPVIPSLDLGQQLFPVPVAAITVSTLSLASSLH